MPRQFNDYGPVQQKFLIRACYEGVALDDPIATRVIRNETTRAQLLERAGLICARTSKKGRTSWRTTEVGRGLVAQHVPTFLHRRGFPSYTSKPWKALHGEPEVIAA